MCSRTNRRPIVHAEALTLSLGSDQDRLVPSSHPPPLWPETVASHLNSQMKGVVKGDRGPPCRAHRIFGESCIRHLIEDDSSCPALHFLVGAAITRQCPSRNRRKCGAARALLSATTNQEGTAVSLIWEPITENDATEALAFFANDRFLFKPTSPEQSHVQFVISTTWAGRVETCHARRRRRDRQRVAAQQRSRTSRSGHAAGSRTDQRSPRGGPCHPEVDAIADQQGGVRSDQIRYPSQWCARADRGHHVDVHHLPPGLASGALEHVRQSHEPRLCAPRLGPPLLRGHADSRLTDLR
jgi:hypothetical protein